MKYEYEQPHLVTKATTGTATAKHSDPSVAPAAVFSSLSQSLAFVGNAPLVGFPWCQCVHRSSFAAVIAAWLGAFWKMVSLGLTAQPCGCSEERGLRWGGVVDWHSQSNNWVNLR